MTTNPRDRIELWFASAGGLAFDHPWRTLLLVLLLCLPFVLQLPKIVIDNRPERMFLKDDPALDDYRRFREQFGTDEYIVVGMLGDDVFTGAFLSVLRDLHRDLERHVPYVAEVTSLVNARHTYGDGDTLVVEGLMEKWPRNAAELAELRVRALSNPFYLNNLVSPDATMATVIIRPRSVLLPAEDEVLAGFDSAPTSVESSGSDGSGQLSSVEFSQMVVAVRDVVRSYRREGRELYVAGGPVVTDAINRAVPKDLATLIPLSVLVIAVFLAGLFRRLSGVAMPLAIVVLSLAVSLGFMVLVGIPLTNITTILTSFLTVVGVADSVHILSRYFQRLGDHGVPRTAVCEAMHHSGLAVLMTSLTTSAGLLSFVVADVRPIAELGVIAPFGVIVALALTLALLPALLALAPGAARSARPSPRFDRILASVAHFSCSRSAAILVISVVLAAMAAVGMTRLRFSQNGLKWFKKGAPPRVATEVVDARLGGTLTIEPVIDTGRTDGLLDPDFLERLRGAMVWAESLERGEAYVAKATSLDTVIMEINRALNGGDPAAYRIPDDRRLIAQELLLFEGTGADDLETVSYTHLTLPTN